jgi:hypothetical protein
MPGPTKWQIIFQCCTCFNCSNTKKAQSIDTRRCILLLEDVDAAFVGRTGANSLHRSTAQSVGPSLSFSGLLNAIDGVRVSVCLSIPLSSFGCHCYCCYNSGLNLQDSTSSRLCCLALCGTFLVDEPTMPSDNTAGGSSRRAATFPHYQSRGPVVLCPDASWKGRCQVKQTTRMCYGR